MKTSGKPGEGISPQRPTKARSSRCCESQLKGVNAPTGTARFVKAVLEGRSVVALLLRSFLWSELQSASSKSTLTSKRLPAKSLISPLKDGVLRSTG
jgi:hypothetical protein